MKVIALWTVACVVTPFLIIQCQPTAVTAAGADQTGGNVTSGCNGDVKDLHIMGFYPFSGAWSGGQTLLISTQMAIEQINNMCVVPGYRLKLHVADSKCSRAVVVREFFHLLHNAPTKLAILGPSCSFVTETIARASRYWNLVQLAYLSLSPTLSDKAVFPTFARVTVPETKANPARISLLRHFGWTRICTLFTNFKLFVDTNDDLVKKWKKKFIVDRIEVFNEDPTSQIQNLVDTIDDMGSSTSDVMFQKEHGCRIIVALFYESTARDVFCKAYRRGLYGRRVVWVLGGWYQKNWWRRHDNNIDCTVQEMDEAVYGYFDVGVVYYNPKAVPSVSGWLPSDFKTAFKAKIKGQVLFGQAVAPQGYDAAWALALALNATRNTLLADGSGKALEDFTYEDKELSALLYRSLLNVSFMGVRGLISFDANGDSASLIVIRRVLGSKHVAVGYYENVEENVTWLANTSVIWEGGIPPRDSTGKQDMDQTLSVSLYAAVCLLAALGILLSLVFLAFNIALRNVRVVKMSSPRLNNVILLGCIFCYGSVFMQDEGGGHGVLGCQVKLVLLVFGISLALGALFAKTWRVHTIFANRKLRKKVIPDGQLIGMVAILVVINMIVLVTWWLNDPQSIKTTSTFTSMINDAAGDVEVSHHEKSCVSDHAIYYLGVLYGIQGLLLLLGTLLAFETRNVHYPELNDSKLIGMCIYNVTILSVPTIVVFVAVHPEVNIKYAISSGLVILGTTVVQCIIFLPKILSLNQSSNISYTMSTTAGTRLAITVAS